MTFRSAPRWLKLAALSAAALTAAPVAHAVETTEPWPPPGGRVVDRIIAVVNVEPVTSFELERALAPFVAQAMRTGGLTQHELVQLEREALDNLVNDLLIRDEAKKLKLEVAPEQVDAQLARVKKQNAWSDAELEEAVKRLGFESLADYRRHAERELLKNQAIGIRVGSRVQIDEAEVERVFAEQFGAGKAVEERRAAHILVRVPEFASAAEEADIKAKMEAIREQAVSGQQSFEDLARRHSADNNAQAGGDLGWFSRGDLVPAFEDAAYALAKGEVSAPVRTEFGFHLIKLIDTRTEQVDAEQRETILRQIRYRLRERELERLYEQWVKELRGGAFVKVMPAQGAAATPAPADAAPAPDSEAPEGTESEAPEGTESEAPEGTESEAPEGTESEAPEGTDAESPE